MPIGYHEKKNEKKLVGISKRLANSRGTITLAKVPLGYTKKIKKGAGL
jgi:hypothetical protein